jgi:uncharacterized membrane protein
MADDKERSLTLRSVLKLPADLAATIALVALTVVVTLAPGISETPLRAVVGFPLVLFVPGYAFVAALFPEAEGRSNDGTSPEDGRAEESSPRLRRHLGGLERVVLSFGLSVAVVPLIGLVMNFTPWGLRLAPVLLSISGFTVVSAAIASLRRRRLSEERRFGVPYRRWYATAREALLRPESRTDAALNVLLALSILIAVPSVTYAVVTPEQDEGFTEFYLLTENETGVLVTDGYPTEFTRGQSEELLVGVTNQELEPMDYTIVVTLQRVETRNGSVRVLAEDELQRFHPTVAAGERWVTTYEMTPTTTGTRLRVLFSLYRGDPPPRTTSANAYRTLDLWVNVTAPQA